jgi:hypothetical protein
MANLYGVANPVVNLGFYGTIGGTTVTCPAGVETNVFQTGPLAALDRGVYYPFCSGFFIVQMGATQATGLVIALRINSGADLASQQYNIPASSGNLALNYAFHAVGPPMATAFWPPGSNIQVSVLTTGFATTVPPGYGNMILGVFRAPDQ